MKHTYIALLRGINVGGHHKVPMADLKATFTTMGFTNIVTLLNSGNVIFNAEEADIKVLETNIAERLASVFGFSIPTIIRSAEAIQHMIKNDPFATIEITKDIRLYVSFLQEDSEAGISFPWTSDDQSFTVLDKQEGIVLSVLDVSVTKTPKGMAMLEQWYGKGITTRNWNTVKRIGNKIES